MVFENKLTEIYKLIRKFYDDTDSHQKTLLRADIEKIVLTGNDILELGLADPKDVRTYYSQYSDEQIKAIQKESADLKKHFEDLESLRKRLAETETKLNIWVNSHEALITEHEKYKTSSENIYKIIQQYEGPIIEEIRQALK